jgi:hypothetical protein
MLDNIVYVIHRKDTNQFLTIPGRYRKTYNFTPTITEAQFYKTRTHAKIAMNSRRFAWNVQNKIQELLEILPVRINVVVDFSTDCPFCGGKKSVTYNEHYKSVLCHSCGKVREE